MKKLFNVLTFCAVFVSMAIFPLNESFATNTHRTDPNGDGVLDISDAVFITGYLRGGYSVSNIDAMDFNGDLIIDAYDAVAVQRCLAGNDY